MCRSEYASTGIGFSASEGVVSGSIDNTSTAISASSGSLNFRGSLVGDQSGNPILDWNTANCAVDASYTYWVIRMVRGRCGWLTVGVRDCLGQSLLHIFFGQLHGNRFGVCGEL